MRVYRQGRGVVLATVLWLGVAPAAAQQPSRTDGTDPGAAALARAPSQPPTADSAPPPAPVEPQHPQVPLHERIAVEPGATCLDRRRLIRRVARWLERDRIDARIHVRVRGDEERAFGVTFTVERSADHERAAVRTIHDAPHDCDQLHSALALSIALAIDATLLEMATAAKAEPLPDDEELLGPAEPEQPRYLRLAAALLGQAGSGVLTGVSLGFGARFELGPAPWLDLRLGAFYTGVSGQEIGSLDGQFSADVLAGRLDVCGVVQPADELRMLVCGGVGAGRFHTRGEGFSPSTEQSELWVATIFGLEAQIRAADWLHVAVGVDLLLPTARRRIQAVSPGGEVADDVTVTSAGIVVGVGPVFRFF
ncbi:MAG: hypothetical protein PVI30_00395 [Myxococcales bacterium]|jgi:hypothetical protein